MARPLWSGSISFGLVNIPVKVVGAVVDRDVHFHLLHAADGSRIKFRRTCAAEGREVTNDEIVKGYDIGGGEYVTFTPEELAGTQESGGRAIDITSFIDMAEVDATYWAKPYFLVPDKNAQKPYALLLTALQELGKAGLARIVMRDKEHLVAIRPKGDLLMLQTMHYLDEVVDSAALASEYELKAAVDKRSLALAHQLIATLSAPFDPSEHHNEYRTRIHKLIEQKTAGDDVVKEPEPKAPRRTPDILQALEESLARTSGRSARERARANAKRATRSARPSPKRATRAARTARPSPKRAPADAAQRTKHAWSHAFTSQAAARASKRSAKAAD